MEPNNNFSKHLDFPDAHLNGIIEIPVIPVFALVDAQGVNAEQRFALLKIKTHELQLIVQNWSIILKEMLIAIQQMNKYQCSCYRCQTLIGIVLSTLTAIEK